MSASPLSLSLSLASEASLPSAPPTPKPARLKLPPRPPVAPSTTAEEARPAPRPVQPQRAQRNAAHAQAAPRTAPRAPGERETRTASAEQERSPAGLPLLLTVDGQGGQRGEGGGGSEGDEQSGGTGAAGLRGVPDDMGDLDCALLAEAMPPAGASGIFEVLLPCGSRLGVAVDIGPRYTSLLLMPSTERLRTQIKKKRRELENTLAQRMETSVRLTVL
ncbi:hypothetical protein [Herbaspirillum seropedicae]|uniref:hypothetical protein n=1 Tax=Herbaspirillum seropedicae TaxID=964 RepID=UPI003FCDC1B9